MNNEDILLEKLKEAGTFTALKPEFNEDQLNIIYAAMDVVKNLHLQNVIVPVCIGGYRKEDECLKYDGKCSEELCSFWQTGL